MTTMPVTLPPFTLPSTTKANSWPSMLRLRSAVALMGSLVDAATGQVLPSLSTRLTTGRGSAGQTCRTPIFLVAVSLGTRMGAPVSCKAVHEGTAPMPGICEVDMVLQALLLSAGDAHAASSSSSRIDERVMISGCIHWPVYVELFRRDVPRG
jgi:hypothetical protein